MFAKFSSAKENVAKVSNINPIICKAAVKGWIKSPGHHANIVAINSHSAVAAYYSEEDCCYYFTQLFGN